MNEYQAIVIGILALPVVVLMVLRINAAIVFMSLCLGYVLMQFLGGDAKSFSESFISNANLSTNIMKLILLLFPPVFTAVFMIHTVRGSRFVLNILPAVGVGCLLVLLVVPLLPPGTARSITSLALWSQALRLQDLIIGAAAVVSLLTLWLQRPHAGKEHGKHH